MGAAAHPLMGAAALSELRRTGKRDDHVCLQQSHSIAYDSSDSVSLAGVRLVTIDVNMHDACMMNNGPNRLQATTV